MNKPNLLEDKPTINADENVWGIKLNKIIDKLQTFVNSIVDTVSGKLDKGNVSNAFSTAERIEQKVKEKLDKSVYDNFKEEIDKHTLDYKTFKKEFIDGNYLRFSTTKNLEDKEGIVKDIVVENITINTINGEPYTKGSNISEEDVKKIGDKHYEPKIEKKSGFNLDISSDVTSNAENIIASTKLVNQINTDLQNKIKNINIEDKIKNKVDKTQLTNIVKDLKLENEKLKYKQYDGTQDVDKEIDLPTGSGGGDNSEFDKYLQKMWKNNTNNEGMMLLKADYKDFVEGQWEDRISSNYTSELYGVIKTADMNHITTVKLDSVFLKDIYTDSIEDVDKNRDTHSFILKPTDAQAVRGSLLKIAQVSSLSKGNVIYMNRINGSFYTNFNRELPINSVKFQYKPNDSLDLPIQEVSKYIQVNTNYNKIYTLQRNSELGLKFISELTKKLKSEETIENNKIYITIGYFYMSNITEIKYLYGKKANDLKIMPISDYTEVDTVSNDFLPKSFYCMCYLTDTEIKYLPLINHYLLKKEEDVIFYNYLKEKYEKAKTWDSDVFYGIVNITPKSSQTTLYKGFNIKDNVLNISQSVHLNESQYSEDILELETDLKQETVDKRYGNNHYGYLKFNITDNYVYILMELDYRPYINQLYISKNAYENIGDKQKQLEYREELLKDVSTPKGSSENLELNNLFNWNTKDNTKNKYIYLDRLTGKVSKISEFKSKYNQKIYPMYPVNTELFRYIPILKNPESYSNDWIKVERELHNPDFSTFKSNFISKALLEDPNTYNLQSNVPYFCMGMLSYDTYILAGTDVTIRGCNKFTYHNNQQTTGHILDYYSKNPIGVAMIGIYKAGSGISLYPLVNNIAFISNHSLYAYFNSLLNGKSFKHIIGMIPYGNKFNSISDWASLGHNELLLSDEVYINVFDMADSHLRYGTQTEIEYNKYRNFGTHIGYLIKYEDIIYFIGENMNVETSVSYLVHSFE
jgi:hypothetical protein